MFRKILKKADSVITTQDGVAKYNEEYRKKYFGNSKCVVRPESAEEVSQILSYCNARKIPIVPQGGRTGLVAGGTPLFEELVISMEKMNKIHEFSPYTGILKLESGTILETADNYVKERGFTFPLDLGARVKS